MRFYLSPQVVEGMPEHPVDRVLAIENYCREQLNMVEQNSIESHELFDARMSYMTAVLASAAHLNIPTIREMGPIPRGKIGSEDWDDFEQSLHFQIVPMVLGRSKAYIERTVALDQSARQRLYSLVGNLKQEVVGLGLSEKRLAKLLEKIRDFEKELENERFSLRVYTAWALGISAAIADLSGSTSAIRSVIHYVSEVVGQAKEAEEDLGALGIGAPATPARREIEGPRFAVAPSRTSSTNEDDEIPF